jgi:hypothetical protein
MRRSGLQAAMDAIRRHEHPDILARTAAGVRAALVIDANQRL